MLKKNVYVENLGDYTVSTDKLQKCSSVRWK